jgi:OPT family oligopeptide transporter
MSVEPENKPFEPFVSPNESPPELTLAPLIVGSLLGIVFGASSVYLVLKVGLTVSASIPVAVLAFAMFKVLMRFGLRKANILENNIVQTAGSAGESIAFGVGLVMPALLLIGFDIDVIRVMTVGVLGGLLGILMMIPLRKAFIVKKHHELKYPEGTACAEVLKAGEQGGSTAGTVFLGFGLGFVYQFIMSGLKLWKGETHFPLSGSAGSFGLKGGAIGCEMSPALMGVGYIIGPRIASIMVAGGVLAYLVITPTIAYFGENLNEVLAPAKSEVGFSDPQPIGAMIGGASYAAKELDPGLIRNKDENGIRSAYILYIGAGAVATGGIISMLNALPVIFGSVFSALKDLRSSGGSGGAIQLRTEQDLPFSVVIFGSVGLVLAIAAAPQLGLGLNLVGILGALMILLFGFLFVTVSSRLTGEIGSSSNPISGMTVATLLLTCLVLVVLGEFGVLTLGKETKLLALTVAAVVCIASSNGGTTSQALKTGHLLGATPRNQQLAILVGSLTSALVIGFVLILMNSAGTIYSKQNLPTVTVDVSQLKDKDSVRRGEYASDKTEYSVLNIGRAEKLNPSLFKLKPGEELNVKPGRYLINAEGKFAYLVDPAVNGQLKAQDNGEEVSTAYKFNAPKTQLFALIIDGIFDRNLPWDLVLIGALIALTLELAGVPSLPFAVGVYLPLAASVPIFVGGVLRWLVDKVRKAAPGDEGDSSPGVLLSSGYIAGASIMNVLLAFTMFSDSLPKLMDLSGFFSKAYNASNWPAMGTFAVLGVVLIAIGSERFGKKSS